MSYLLAWRSSLFRAVAPIAGSMVGFSLRLQSKTPGANLGDQWHR